MERINERIKENLRGRSLLRIEDFSREELTYLLELAAELKRKKHQHIPHHDLSGKNIALLFEKPSTRTRCAFTVASIDLGAHPEYLGKGDIQFGKKESVEDTARVLGRMFDGIEFRGFSQDTVNQLAAYSGVPVWNGLTDESHPTQILADFLTIKEQFGKLKGVTLLFIGDGRNNVANSLLIGASKFGMDMRICGPRSLFPNERIVSLAKSHAEESGGSVMVTDDIGRAAAGADVIYTDVWVSMGEEDKYAERIRLLKPYQVNRQLIEKTGKDNYIFLHCLPSIHDLNTEIGRSVYEKFGLKAMEVTDEIFKGPHSHVFDEAENRMHTIKAVMLATLQNE